MFLLNDLKLEKKVEEIPFMKEYMNIMKKIVLSVPDKRPSAEETLTEMQTILSNIGRIEKEEMRKVLTPDFRNPQNIKDRRKKMANVKTVSIKRTLELNKKKKQMKRVNEQ